MIHLTAEVLCDCCGKVCGVGAPTPGPQDGDLLDRTNWLHSALASAEAKARSHGARINVASVTCADCLKKMLADNPPLSNHESHV